MDQKIIFLHIPKTAGSSLRHIVEQEYTSGACIHIYSEHPDFAAIRKDLPTAKVIYGHISYGVHDSLGVQGRYITFVRNPVERVLSYYNHLCRHEATEGMTLLNMLRSERFPKMNNHMVRVISGYEDNGTIDDTSVFDKAISNIEKDFEFVGLSERMSESVNILGRKLSWKKEYPVPLLNVNVGPHLLEIDAKTLEAVKKYNRLDIMLYELIGSSFTTSLKHYTDRFGEDVMKGAGFYFKAFPRKLNLGCGFDIREAYLNVDLNDVHKPDLVADVCNLEMLPTGYYEEIVAQNVLEYIPRKETKRTLLEWNRLLKPNGILMLRVPNLSGLVSLFETKENQTVAKQEKLTECLFGTQKCDGDFRHTIFTEMLLEHYLNVTSFLDLGISIEDGWLFDVVAQKRNFGELLDISDNYEFLVQTYRSILERDPDTGGLDHYLSEMEAGETTREFIIENLLYSEEKKDLLSFQEQERDFGELLDISDNYEFLVQTYRSILERDPDTGGLEYYLSKLAHGDITKKLIIKTLIDSEEGKKSPGVDESDGSLNAS